MTTSPVISPGRFLVFWPISVMYFRWYLIVKRFPTLTAPFIKLLCVVSSSAITIGFTVTLSFISIFSSLARSKYLSLFSLSVIFIYWSAGTTMTSIRRVFFFGNYHLVWSSGWDLMIFFYLKIPDNFMFCILSDKFWFVNIPFGWIIQFKFPIHSCLVLYLLS